MNQQEPELKTVFRSIHKVKELTSVVQTLKSKLEEQEKELTIYRIKASSTKGEVAVDDFVEVKRDLEPKLDIWPAKAFDICVCHSEETGATSATELQNYFERSSLKSVLLSCPALRLASSQFNTAKCEEIIASSGTLLLLITKYSLEQQTTIFCLKVALAYKVDILLVHDLGSMPFPTVSRLPKIYMDSGIFNDKAITYLSEYRDTSGRQILEKFKSDSWNFDLAIVSSEGSNREIVYSFQVEFDHIRTTNLTLTSILGTFQENVLKKAFGRAISIMMLLTPQLNECWDSFVLLLKMANEHKKRILFAYPESEKGYLGEIFQHRLGNTDLDVAMEILFKELGISRETLFPIPPLVETHTPPLHFCNKSKLQLDVPGREQASIIYHLGVTHGKWYYEVTLDVNGSQQIGWNYKNELSMKSTNEFIGQTETSFSFDGYKLKRMNADIESYGIAWLAGCYLDLDSNIMRYSLSGKDLGIAFDGFDNVDRPVYPAISLAPKQGCTINFGDKPFAFPPDPEFKSMVQAPINTQYLFPYKNPFFAAEKMIEKEKRFGGCIQVEELTTNAFLSHKRSSAQGMAGRIFQELNLDYKIFLDSEANFNLHNLQLIVKYTGLFVFILSEGIFDSYWCLEELRAAIRFKRRILVIRNFDFNMPTIWPYELLDIKETILNADTIIYMAEFFSECLNKIKLRLGPTTSIVSKIEKYLRLENPTMYHNILENAFDAHSSIDVSVTEDMNQFTEMWSVIKYYYGCSSLSNVGEIHLHASHTTNLKYEEVFDTISAACPNIERLEFCVIKNAAQLVADNCVNLESLQLLSIGLMDVPVLKTLTNSLHNLRELTIFESSKITDENYESIGKNCPRIQKLNVSSDLITDEAIKHLGEGCHEITELLLGTSTKLTDKSLEYLGNGCPKLTKFDCRKNKNFSNVGLNELAKCTKLRCLLLHSTFKCNDTGVCNIVKSCPEIEEFHISATAQVTDVSYKAVGNSPMMRIMALTCFKITDNGVFELKKCRNLQELIVSTSLTLTDAALVSVSEHLPAIQAIKFTVAKYITNAGLFAIATGCKNITFVEFNSENITDEGVIALARGCKNLRTVNICSPKLTNESWLQIAYNCNQLTYISNSKNQTLEDSTLVALGNNCPDFVEWNLGGTTKNVTDIGFGALKTLNLLKSIQLPDSVITNKGIEEYFSEERPYCLQNLVIPRAKLTDSCMHLFPKRLQGTSIVDLSDSQLTDIGFSELGKIYLREVHLTNTQFSEATLAAVYRKSVGFEQLYLENYKDFDDSMCRFLGLPKKRVTTIQLESATKITNKGLQIIGTYDTLTYLNLNSLPITDQGIAMLAGCTSLCSLQCKSAVFTDTGLCALVAKKKPLAQVNFASAKITDKGLLALCANNPIMTYIVIDSATVTAEGIIKAKLNWLQEFSLAGGTVKSKEVFEAILKACKEVVDMRVNAELSSDLIPLVQGLKRLKSLKCDTSKITQEELENVNVLAQ